MKIALKRLESSLGVYANPQMLVLTLMGFSAGLPQVALGQPLQAWVTTAGWSTVAIGLLSLVGQPFAFKWLWAPLMDRFIPPALGRLQGSRRRTWMTITQILLLLTIGFLGFQDPSRTDWLLGVTIAIAFFSASQDIVIDAYRTDSLTEPEMGAGAAVYVFGYRIALLVASSIALFLADPNAKWVIAGQEIPLHLSWAQIYGFIAVLMLVGLVTSYFAPEPDNNVETPPSMTAAVVEPFRAFFQRYRRIRIVGWPDISWLKPLQTFLERPQALLTLVFIVIYQLADRISSPQTTTFLLKGLGFSPTDLAIRIWIIFLATIGGVFVGGWAVKNQGILRALFWFGILQGLSNLSFMGLALLGKNYPAMIGATIIENFCAGTATAAFLAFLMSLCDRHFTATQYALLSSLFAFGGSIVGSWSGFVAQLGWPAFWGLTALGALPGLVLLPFLRSHPQEPASQVTL